MRVLAIDFETADTGRDSACAVGAVLVDDGMIVDRYYSLIRPPRPRVMFTAIHGIRWHDVADKACFGELWPDLAPLLGKDFFKKRALPTAVSDRDHATATHCLRDEMCVASGEESTHAPHTHVVHAYKRHM